MTSNWQVLTTIILNIHESRHCKIKKLVLKWMSAIAEVRTRAQMEVQIEMSTTQNEQSKITNGWDNELMNFIFSFIVVRIWKAESKMEGK